jgi:hypothetical protein
MPKFAVDPGHAGDEAVGFNCSEHGSGFGIDLMDLAATVLADPERSFGPGEPRIPATAGRRDRGQHFAGLGIDLTDHGFRDLEQVSSVECRSRMRGDFDRAQNLSAFRIKGIQPVAGGEPHPPPVKTDPTHAIDSGKRAIFADDFCFCVFHGRILTARQRCRE